MEPVSLLVSLLVSQMIAQSDCCCGYVDGVMVPRQHDKTALAGQRIDKGACVVRIATRREVVWMSAIGAMVLNDVGTVVL
jgi:hypothetical protein